MSFARVNGAVLHWHEMGPQDGPAVAMVNSLGSDLRIWDVVAAELALSWRVIRYDLRGHGLSDLPPDGFGIDDHVADLAGLLDQNGISACAVVGISLGGLIAQGFAARFPQRTRALVLCDTAARIGTREGWDGRIAMVTRDGLAAIADAVVERWVGAAFRSERAEAVAGWRNMLLRTPVAGYAAACAAIRDADLTQSTAAIRAPCLCVVGAEDVPTPPEQVRALADLILGARYEVIEASGHLPCLDQPDRLATLIRRHLREAGDV